MFRNIKYLFLAGAVLLVVGAMTTAAVSVTMDRTVTAALTADNDTNAAIVLTCLNNKQADATKRDYSDICQTTSSTTTLELERGWHTGGTISLNRGATFQIGSSGTNDQVLKITNNGEFDAIRVSFDSTQITMYSSAGVALTAAGGANYVDIDPAGNATFYFSVTTPGSSTDSSVTGTLQIRTKPAT